MAIVNITPSQNKEIQGWVSDLLERYPDAHVVGTDVMNSDMNPRDVIVEYGLMIDGKERHFLQVFGWQGGRKVK